MVTADPRTALEERVGPLTSCDTLFCIPVIEPPTDRHREQWNLDGDGILVVDHTPTLDWKPLALSRGWRYVGVGRNLGTGGAWNLGRDILLHEYRPQDLLVILSAYCDLPAGLGEVRYAFRQHASWKGAHALGYGWHLIALSGLLLAEIGTFDECLPHYFGDNDWVYRGILAGHFLAGADTFPEIEIAGATPPASGGAKRSGRVEDFSYRAYAGYYRAKWFGNTSEETALTPFGLDVPTSWWSPRWRPTVDEDGTPGWLPFVEGAA